MSGVVVMLVAVSQQKECIVCESNPSHVDSPSARYTMRLNGAITVSQCASQSAACHLTALVLGSSKTVRFHSFPA